MDLLVRPTQWELRRVRIVQRRTNTFDNRRPRWLLKVRGMFGQPKHTKPTDDQAKAQTNMWGNKATMRKRIPRPHRSSFQSNPICLRAYLIFRTFISSDKSSNIFKTGSTYMYAKNIVTNNKNVPHHHVVCRNNL